ncbi:MAG: 1-acyl-sn-glycerol-3-phosphate acyltransferase [Prevotella sp.]|nr:1-acyl-sn-glycerol-3-phosphate acyltransferase [Prevotella sp.]MBR6998048.1 1-acyl-sn-glycerol-3-phosphate acyltransferase [Prevotella sp.]
MKYLYRAYQLLIALPLGIIVTIITALITVIGCSLGGGHFWGYYPGHCWGRIVLWLLLIPVKVEGREHLGRSQSYVFVANHQGAFDIFLIYGYLGRNFKWMMKQSLRKMPFVGWACEKSKQIFVDKRGASSIKKTYDAARSTLQGGTSVVVFPEGSRTFTGHMGTFKRGAFMLADELQLPVVPMTINGSFNIMPRMRDGHFVCWHPLRLTIHPAVYPKGQGTENVQATLSQVYDTVMSALEPEYQGYKENPDQ